MALEHKDPVDPETQNELRQVDGIEAVVSLGIRFRVLGGWGFACIPERSSS